MRLQGGGGKDRKSLHIVSCQAWDEDRVGGKYEAAGSTPLKKLFDIPVPSRDVTYQTLPRRE